MANGLDIFAFSNADKERLMACLPDVLDYENTGNDDWKKWSLLSEKRLRMHLHAVFLKEYCKTAKIPRGLRIQKGPTLFVESDEFKKKWIAILNKCALDLMLLFIEKSIEDTARLDSEINTLEQKMKDSMLNIEAFDQKLGLLKNNIQELEKKIRDTKTKKLHRDSQDYETGRVYKWDNIMPPKRKQVSWSDLSSNNSDADYSSENDAETARFRRNRPNNNRNFFTRDYSLRNRDHKQYYPPPQRKRPT